MPPPQTSSLPFLPPGLPFATQTPTTMEGAQLTTQPPQQAFSSAITPYTTQPTTALTQAQQLANLTTMAQYAVAQAAYMRLSQTGRLDSIFAPTTLPTVPVSSSGRSDSTPYNAGPARNQAPNMDPTPEDPTATFIHPPFDNFTGEHYPDGLTFSIMAEHQDWFLDANDYKAAGNDNPDAVPYPAQLEPPRGWCPGKKKELRQLGPDGWPAGEEPRLRCTFCRRTYAGVNAKSMWRRHVYEKHKIAMSNRRDGTERVRGRQSNKENKKNARQSLEGSFSDLGSATPVAGPSSAPRSRVPSSSSMQPPSMPAQTQFSASAIRSGKISMEAVLDSHRPRSRHHQRRVVTPSKPLPPIETDSEFDLEQLEDHLAPELEPAPEPTPAVETVTAEPELVVSSEQMPAPAVPATPSRIVTAIIRDSPYDPAATPDFRHSPTRIGVPPLRFPNPDHPLAMADVILGGHYKSDYSPGIFGLGTPKFTTWSPFARQTPGSSPGFAGLFGDKHGKSSIFDEPLDKTQSPWRFLSGSTPRRLFGMGGSTPSTLRTAQSLASLDDNIDLTADLSGDSSGVFSDIIDSSWSSGGSHPALGTPIKLAIPGSTPGDDDSPVARRGLVLPKDKETIAVASRLFVSKSSQSSASDKDGDDDACSLSALQYPDETNSLASDDESESEHEEFGRPIKRRKLTAA